ncbi:hypothetical protein NWF32_16925 [Pseudomonas qingdaonensis]|nr:hypothetical protein [Pseudomonas qingdaonensis]
MPDAGGALRQALDERLRDLLGLMPGNGVATRLAELKMDAEDFVGCLEQALDALQLDVPIDAWRGAVSLEEVVERLVGEAAVQPEEAARLESLNALPGGLSASLAAIARSLQEGAMRWCGGWRWWSIVARRCSNSCGRIWGRLIAPRIPGGTALMG